MYLLEECEDLRPVLCIAPQQVRNPANQPTGHKDDIIYHYKKVARQAAHQQNFADRLTVIAMKPNSCPEVL